MLNHTITLQEEQVAAMAVFRAACSCGTWRGPRCETEKLASFHGVVHLDRVDKVNKAGYG